MTLYWGRQHNQTLGGLLETSSELKLIPEDPKLPLWSKLAGIAPYAVLTLWSLLGILSLPLSAPPLFTLSHK